MRILIVEDSEKLLRALGRGLRKMGYSVDLVSDGNEGYDYARLNDYDVIVLDLLLPGMDGLTLLTKLRKLGNETHVLILSAKDQVEDRVKGLELGADDYMIKPFSFEELCARLNTLVRRRYEKKNPEHIVGPVTINTAARQVRLNNDIVNLTPGEYAILECLTLNRGQVLSKEQILDSVHDCDSFAGPNVVEVMVCTLRKKIGNGNTGSIIRTRRGYGYYVE